MNQTNIRSMGSNFKDVFFKIMYSNGKELPCQVKNNQQMTATIYLDVC